jgi:YVTN family beta-propeller protein
MATKGANGGAEDGIGRWVAALVVVLSAAVLSACGGGGGGGGGGSSSGGGAGSYLLSGVLQLNLANPLPNGLPSGLNLSDGKETISPAAGATTFAFPTALATGTQYTVSVLGSPAGLICSASSNTGTIASADVSNVVVSCSDASYTVGGTVSGLGSGSVQLTNNGADMLTVSSGATSFTFSTPVAYGGAYAVAVQSQPAGQTCSVGHASGTMSAANVGNVTITCSAQGFSLGGTVSGLTGPGLVLANGADTVPVAAGAASFSFANAVASGGLYSVTVQAQPAGEHCSVTNGSGTATAAVTSVQVNCAAQTYTVGGAISWPAGLSGLTLANNGTDATSPSAGATSYTFAAAMASGSAYAVSVTANPTGYVCTVANATGTIGSSNVINASVTCSAQGYNLGGTVSGLTASGLVLANGTQTVTVAAGATSFTFSQPIANGGGYAVSVQTQPSGQTCSVSNGSGTMQAGGVSNVAVTCHGNAYNIGGTITGLTAAGLVLANGTDTVHPAAGAASFTMPGAVAQGGSYNVVVQTQPLGLLNCTVANGSGVATAAVTNISVTCAPGSGVSGSVTGYHSSGLVLANGSATLSPICTTCWRPSFGVSIPITSGSVTPTTLALNPVTHRVYGIDPGGLGVFVVDEISGAQTTITLANPGSGNYVSTNSIAIDTASNRIYAVYWISPMSGAPGAYYFAAIDGNTNALLTTLTLPANCPRNMAVNKVTHAIYVANGPYPCLNQSGIMAIDGTTYAVSTIPTGLKDTFIAVNESTNKIYVSNSIDGTVTAIDGATHATQTIPVGVEPGPIAVNPSTNRIYVANVGGCTQVNPVCAAVGNTVTVIDGATNATSTVQTGLSPGGLVVNPVTNRIYVANTDSTDRSVTIIDGATNQTRNVAGAAGDDSGELDPINGLVIYHESSCCSVITGISYTGILHVIDDTTGIAYVVGNVGNNISDVRVDPATGYLFSGYCCQTHFMGLIDEINILEPIRNPGSAAVPASFAVAAGAAYNITVQAQPAGQTCTVTNGSGTIGQSAATNLAVNCVDLNVPLAGTITGLTSEMELSVNFNANAVENFGIRTTNSNFILVDAPAQGSAYSVTTVGNNPPQTCVVTNGSGTVTGPVVRVSVACQ